MQLQTLTLTQSLQLIVTGPVTFSKRHIALAFLTPKPSL